MSNEQSETRTMTVDNSPPENQSTDSTVETEVKTTNRSDDDNVEQHTSREYRRSESL